MNPRKAFERTLKESMYRSRFDYSSRTVARDASVKVTGVLRSLEKTISLITEAQNELFEAYQVPEDAEVRTLVWLDERLEELYNKCALIKGKMVESLEATNAMQMELKKI